MVEATGPDRRLRPGLQLAARDGQGATYRLRETAAGRYEAVIPLDDPGLHLFTVYEINGETWNTGWVSTPRPGAPASRARYRLFGTPQFFDWRPEPGPGEPGNT